MPQEIMYDSVGGISQIPSSAELVLVYIDGKYVTNQSALRFQCPIAQFIPTTTQVPGSLSATIFDCERGDGNANDAANWAVQKLMAHERPTIYCSRIGSPGYGYPDVQLALNAKHVNLFSVDFGIADYTGIPHLVMGSAFTQYANPLTSGGDYDKSITNGIWPNQLSPTDPTIPIKEPTMTAIVEGDVIKIYCEGAGSRSGHLLEFTRSLSDPTHNSIIDITLQIGTADLYTITE